MTRKTIVSSLVWALSVGGLVAVLNGERRAISLRIWLAAFAIWFAFATAQRLFAEVPLTTQRLLPLVRWRRARPSAHDGRLAELRALENLVLRAGDNERAYAQQLQPRLEALVDHYLPVTHGIDRRTEPKRAAALFGDLDWLIDDRPSGRTATTPEIDALLDVLLGEERSVATDSR